MDIKDMKVKICLADTDIFQNMLGILQELLSDERIKKDVKDEYASKFKTLTNLKKEK